MIVKSIEDKLDNSKRDSLEMDFEPTSLGKEPIVQLVLLFEGWLMDLSDLSPSFVSQNNN